MFTTNPYTQAGWSNSQNIFFVPEGTWRLFPSQAPTYGALPSPTGSESPDAVTFNFDSRLAGPLNCSVFGSSRHQKFYDIVTEDGPPKVVKFQKANGRTFATVEWSQQPVIEIAELVPKKFASEWLFICPGQTVAIMELGEEKYTWMLQNNAIYLYKPQVFSQGHAVLAKIYRGSEYLSLSVNISLIQEGKLEAIIVAAALLQSG